MSDKVTLRKKALKQRSVAYGDDDGMAARNVAAQVIMLPELDICKKVACYYPIRDELDSMIVLKALHAARFDISLPKIVAKDEPLEFRRWDMRAPLAEGPFGTKEPTSDMTEPQVILAPLVAFDENGARLGYGGGYYDRTLAELRSNNPDLLVVGLAYENQKLASIPADSYDQPLDIVITEKTTYRFDN